MNKGELVAAVAQQAGLNKADATAAIDATLQAISDSLKRGEEVRLTGFGNFVVTKRPAGPARNPRTGETFQREESATPKFRPGATLKAAVNGKKAEAEGK